jgi:hypothetical protein
MMLCTREATLNNTENAINTVTMTLAGVDSFNQTIARMDAWNNKNARASHAGGPERVMMYMIPDDLQ